MIGSPVLRTEDQQLWRGWTAGLGVRQYSVPTLALQKSRHSSNTQRDCAEAESEALMSLLRRPSLRLRPSSSVLRLVTCVVVCSRMCATARLAVPRAHTAIDTRTWRLAVSQRNDRVPVRACPLS